MAEAEKPVLRIYCVCGQKMKVTGSLFGRPGKCVACRQKIRIPRFDEIEPGVEDIHLKDHPEYLRKAPRPASASKSSGTAAGKEVVIRRRSEDDTPSAEEEHVALGDDSESISTVPLDVLEPLKTVASLEYKLKRQLKKVDKDDTSYAEIRGRLARIEHVHHDLEEKLRQSLMEVAIELATAQDKIAQTQLAARIGEIEHDEFRQDIYRQRSRRDRLEQRQQNLRGWLAANTLELSGGYLDLPPEAAPDDGFAVPIPHEEKTTTPLVDVHTAALREAFAIRANAERKRAEIRKIANDPNNTRRWKTDRLNARSEEIYSEANIKFRQERLTQLRTDYTEDLETLAALADLVRGRMQSGQLDRAAYDKEEKKISRARTDLKKALSICERALMANAAEDVPRPRGTFLARMADAERESMPAGDVPAWLMRAGAALIFVGVWLPLVGSFGYPGTLPFVVALLSAGGFVAISFMREPTSRVVALSAVWSLSLFACAWLIRVGEYELGATAAAFRSGPALLLRPGFLAIVLGAGTLFAAIVMCMRQVGQTVAGTAGVAFFALVLVGIAATDVFGSYRPAPSLDVTFKPMGGGVGQFTQVTVRNDGGRALYLAATETTARSGYEFFVERQIGANSWSEVEGTRWPQRGAASALTIESGDSASKSFSLPGGNYRAVLMTRGGSPSIQSSFTAPDVAPPVQFVEPDPEPIEVVEIPESSPSVRIEEPDEPVLEVLGTTIAFQGAGLGADGAYRLSFQVTDTGSSTRRMFTQVGQDLAEGWRVTLFDPDGGVVTLELDDERMTIGTGESRFLPRR